MGGVSVHSDAEPGVVSQFTVTLQSEEQVAAEWCREPGRAATLTSYGKSHEFCLHTRKTHVSLPIPLTATPAFVTDMGEGVAGVRGWGVGGGGEFVNSRWGEGRGGTEGRRGSLTVQGGNLVVDGISV